MKSPAQRLPSLVVAFIALLVLCRLPADEPKNHDFDVVRDEAAVPPY